MLTTKQRYDAKRAGTQPWRSWYKTAEWKRIRAEVLKRQPICNICKKANADTVDHVRKHGGDRVKFFAGPFQALCAHCHNTIKQSWERVGKPVVAADGWKTIQKPHGYMDWDDLHQPKDIRASRPALTLLFGPPAAGKSTYVQAHKQPGDIIIDADIEATRLGIDRYTQSNGERVKILSARNDALRNLSTSDAPAAWFTAIGGQPKIRLHWTEKLRPKNIIILMTPAKICIERIKATRATHHDAQIRAVMEWYDQYKPSAGETIVTDWRR